MMKYCFGVDVGGTTVKLGLFTVEGELLDKWEIKTYTENEGERILPDVAEAIKGKIAEKLLKAEEICGIGVGVPAPVDKNGAIERAANVGWMAKEIKKEAEKDIPAPDKRRHPCFKSSKIHTKTDISSSAIVPNHTQNAMA